MEAPQIFKKLRAGKIPSTLDLLRSFDQIPDKTKLELYPPFLFMGVKVLHVSADSRELRVRLPLRWYALNHNGTMFGGFMASLADPLPAIICGKLFPGTEVWTKKSSIQFLRPGRTDLEVRVTIDQEDIDTIAADLEASGSSAPRFTFYFYDTHEKKVAKVVNTVAIRRRGRPSHG